MDNLRKWFARPLEEGVTVFGWLALTVVVGLTLCFFIPWIWSEADGETVLNFFGVVFAAGITVWGSAYVAAYRYNAEKKENAKDNANILLLEVTAIIGYFEAAVFIMESGDEDSIEATFDHFSDNPIPKISALADTKYMRGLDNTIRIELLVLNVRILKEPKIYIEAFYANRAEFLKKMRENIEFLPSMKERVTKLKEFRDKILELYPELSVIAD